MELMDERSDDDLLAATRAEPEAFAVFYRRHVDSLLAYFARRTRDAELAADLTAETFAAALDGAHRHRPERGPGGRRGCTGSPAASSRTPRAAARSRTAPAGGSAWRR